MNRDNVRALAALIRSLPSRATLAVGQSPGCFDMGAIAHTCGAPACIAGWACWLALEGDEKTDRIPDLVVAMDEAGWTFNTDVDLTMAEKISEYDLAREWLGISDRYESEALFEPTEGYAHWAAMPDDPSYITNAHAAAVLEHYPKTSTIDWGIYKRSKT